MPQPFLVARAFLGALRPRGWAAGLRFFVAPIPWVDPHGTRGSSIVRVRTHRICGYIRTEQNQHLRAPVAARRFGTETDGRKVTVACTNGPVTPRFPPRPWSQEDELGGRRRAPAC